VGDKEKKQIACEEKNCYHVNARRASSAKKTLQVASTAFHGQRKQKQQSVLEIEKSFLIEVIVECVIKKLVKKYLGTIREGCFGLW